MYDNKMTAICLLAITNIFYITSNTLIMYIIRLMVERGLYPSLEEVWASSKQGRMFESITPSAELCFLGTWT